MWEKIVEAFGGSILGGVQKLIEEFHMSPEDKAKLQLALREQELKLQSVFMEADKAQAEINKEEAKSANLFVAGWRPFIGWACGAALVYAALLEPMVQFIAVVGYHYAGAFPVLNTEIMLQVLLGMLGLAGMRSFEKFKGVS